ncbi:MAG: HAD family hydrolase, partial [Woeseiaceae bacterium]|nr:HAD family hydrolase [Woeseiaceae bacterium]
EPSDIREIRSQVVAEFSDCAHDLTFIRRMVLGRVGVAAGYGTEFIDEAFRVFDEVRNDVEIFPGVIPALESLREHFTVIVITNGNANLTSIGISHLFDDVVTAIKAGAAKPASKIFEMAVKLGGAKAEETLHVGDHPRLDVDGARNAGLRTAWVNWNESDWPDEFDLPDIEIAHVCELLRLLDKN